MTEKKSTAKELDEACKSALEKGKEAVRHLHANGKTLEEIEQIMPGLKL